MAVKLSTMPSSMAAISVRQAVHAAEHADGEHAADVLAADGGLDRLDDDEEAPASDAVAMEMPKAMRLMRIGSTASSRSAELVLGDGHDGAADEGVREIELQADDKQNRDDAGHQHPEREIEEAEAPGRTDVDGLT